MSRLNNKARRADIREIRNILHKRGHYSRTINFQIEYLFGNFEAGGEVGESSADCRVRLDDGNHSTLRR